jgi:hypothetical protein
MHKRKVLFVTLVCLSVLSTIGMVYFYYLRYNCKPIGNSVVTRDWRGKCYMTTTREVLVEGDPGRLRVVERKSLSVWIDGQWVGVWMPEGWQIGDEIPVGMGYGDGYEVLEGAGYKTRPWKDPRVD